jgi:two-component system, cell cycle sensor histidine kinase and response regulator CckA
MINLRQRSISRDLTVALVIVVLFASALVIAINYLISIRNALEQLNQKAGEYTAYLVDSLELPIWHVDEEGVRKIAQSYLNNELIAELRIEEASGAVLFEKVKSGHTDFIERAGVIRHNGQPIGRVKIGLTARLYREYNRRQLWSSVVTMLVSIFVLIGLTGILLRVLLRNPIDNLVDGIDRIALGDYEYRFNGGKQSEIEVILSRCNFMAEQIRAREKSLNKVNRQLGQEVVDHKNAEKALRESEEKYRLLFENASDAIFITQDGIVKFPNPRAEEMVGYTAGELAAIPLAELIHEEDRDLVVVRANPEIGAVVPTQSFRILTRSGEALWAKVNTVPVQWEGRPATLNFLRDLTQERKLEDQFQRSQRMEAIGTLAGGIAHDFNNLLMGIQGRTSLMMIDAETGHPHYDHLKGIETYILSATELTRQLLGFARGGKYEVRPTDLNRLVGKAAGMFGRTKKEIHIHGKYQDGLWAADVDGGQIEQVLVNLFVNAWQAMPGGGSLYLETENVNLDRRHAGIHQLVPGRYVRIRVTDTGMGMDDTTQARIFDPFFTTKEMGRGTGLGLASVYGIIKNHGGSIGVYSKKGEGSTFTFYLPASEKAVAVEGVTTEKTVAPGSETILLADDEPVIIDVGSQMLERMGYRVLTAAGGTQTVDVFQRDRARIDLVILDMIMPDMGGGETFDRLKAIDPMVRVILSSGYSINGKATEILNRGCRGFIQKPFNMENLSNKVRQVLDNA